MQISFAFTLKWLLLHPFSRHKSQVSSQRKDGKKLVSSYVWENDKEKLQQIAKEQGVTMSDLIKAMVTELDNLKKDAKDQIYKSARNLD